MSQADPSGVPRRAADLYRRSAGGDRDAVLELLEAYLPRLRGFVRARLSPALRRRESGDDVVQSVCREVLERRGKLDFADEERFRAWLFTATHAKIAAKARFHGRQRRDMAEEKAIAVQSGERDDLLAHAYCGVQTPSQGVAAREEVERIESALDALPEDYREVIALARIAELPHAVVAERMNRSVDAMRKLLGRALLRLTAVLRSRDGGAP